MSPLPSPFARVPSFRARHAERNQGDRLRQWKVRGTLARAFVGAVSTATILCAGTFIFGPFSDLSTLQLAAGPRAAAAAGSAPAAIVLARTGRAWGAEAQQRSAAAASAPLVRVARRDDRRAP